MAGDELFKRYLEMGASVLGMSRERADTIVKDLVASGEVARGQAAKAAEWLVERGRAGTEELAELVRREVRQQVAALGLATKDDIARLEADLAEARAASGPDAASPAPPAAPVTSPAPPTAAAAGPTARPRPGKAAGTSRKAAGAKKAATASPTATDGGAGEGKAAGISRSGSVRRRPSPGGSTGPDPAPPAGGAVPPEG
jgi:polyhydroxyalkanoate synthesis regulator phasin